MTVPPVIRPDGLYRRFTETAHNITPKRKITAAVSFVMFKSPPRNIAEPKKLKSIGIISSALSLNLE